MKYLIFIGLIVAGSHASASGRFGVECTTAQLRMTFTTFGMPGTERFAIVKFQGKEISKENFELRGKDQYEATIENLHFTLGSYPLYRGDEVPFSVSIRMFGSEYIPFEEGYCQSMIK